MSERDLADEIYNRLTSKQAIDTALELWGDLTELEPRERMLHLIAILAGDTIGDLLIEREHQAARTGRHHRDEAGRAMMTSEEYRMLRSIAEADGTAGPNFDPSLLQELLDAYDENEKLRRDAVETERLRSDL